VEQLRDRALQPRPVGGAELPHARRAKSAGGSSTRPTMRKASSVMYRRLRPASHSSRRSRKRWARSNRALSRLSAVTSENSEMTCVGRSQSGANCGTDVTDSHDSGHAPLVVQAEQRAVDGDGRAQCAHRRHVVEVDLAAALVDDQPVVEVERRGQRLAVGDAEHAHRRRVARHDAPVGIVDDDALVDRLQQLVVAQLGFAALGEVARHRDDVALAAVVEGRRCTSTGKRLPSARMLVTPPRSCRRG
jgi:hypothetical protein